MDIAALIISVFALFASTWSALNAQRQARAANAQAASAEEANRTAHEALDLARQSEKREADRQHAEERPNFALTGKRTKPLIVTVTITNEGRFDYENVVVKPDMSDPDTTLILHGMSGPNDHLVDEVSLGACKPGETLTTALVRCDAHLGGKVKLLVTASRSTRQWTTVHYVTVTNPPRAVVM